MCLHRHPGTDQPQHVSFSPYLMPLELARKPTSPTTAAMMDLIICVDNKNDIVDIN